MVELLVLAESPDEEQTATRFGGRPLVANRGAFEWPRCAQCEDAAPMQFLCQIAVENGGEAPLLIQLFMCAAEEGCCTWEPESGSNRALIQLLPAREVIDPPADARTALRTIQHGAQVLKSAHATYDVARDNWTELSLESPRLILGQLGGEPAWIQGDETPTCECGRKMQFVAQVEEGPASESAMNFGGGCAYVFRCGSHAAKMLWQQ